MKYKYSDEVTILDGFFGGQTAKLKNYRLNNEKRVFYLVEIDYNDEDKVWIEESNLIKTDEIEKDED